MNNPQPTTIPYHECHWLPSKEFKEKLRLDKIRREAQPTPYDHLQIKLDEYETQEEIERFLK